MTEQSTANLRRILCTLSLLTASIIHIGCAASGRSSAQSEHTALPAEHTEDPALLGAFSVSLSVQDLTASRAFYETLGFRVIGGIPRGNWLIMRSGSATIGHFQGMFEGNILTFNPGWSAEGNPIPSFTDIRDLQAMLKAAGIPLTLEADPDSNGPAHLIFTDPDGNTIMLDQHVWRP